MGIRTYFENIADAIRQKTGTQDTYTPEEMPDAIVNIPSGGGLPTITEDEWDELTTEEKRSYGLIGVISSNSGFQRGFIYNGTDYIEFSFLANFGNGKSGNYNYNYEIPKNGTYLIVSIVGEGGQPASVVHSETAIIQHDVLLTGGNNRFVRYEICQCEAGDVLTINCPTNNRANGGICIFALENTTYNVANSVITRDGTTNYTLPNDDSNYIVVAVCTGRTSQYATTNSNNTDYIYRYNENVLYEYTRILFDFTEGNGSNYSCYGYDGGCSAIIAFEVN